MPDSDTFSIPPIATFFKKYLMNSKVSCDPFSRNKRWTTYTNDLDPNTCAEYHKDAELFLKMLSRQGTKCDLVIFDPPYSPRQISECYNRIGLHCDRDTTQNSVLYSRVKSAILEIIAPEGMVLSFGWNSSGMGVGFEMLEVMLVCHGGAHNDTICLAEKRLTDRQIALGT